MNKILLFYIYLMFVCVLSMMFYLFGYFPVKVYSGKVAHFSDLPSESAHSMEELYSRPVDRMIFLVIDALRYDFVDGPLSKSYMPYLSYLKEKNDVCIVKTKVDPPTVTMPRIKSMVSGTKPGFIDVVMNFGSKEMSEDNFVKQAVSNNLSVVFYGDDTWLKLFPRSFNRYNGTTSFFVSDYTEVDDNVTYNVLTELKNSDWDIMFLHYLGLDHIGHLEGPTSSLVKPKMNEMDGIVKVILNDFVKSSTGKRNILCLCGDHGMKDTGGHGGSTDPEVYVPFAVFGLDCPLFYHEYISQRDITPTLSSYFGLPIPSESLGKLHPELLFSNNRSKLMALHYNTWHLLNMYRLNKGPGPFLDKTVQKINHIFDLWLNGNEPVDETSEIYGKLQDSILDHITSKTDIDFYLLLFSMCYFLQICLLLVYNCPPEFLKNIPSFIGYVVLIYCFHLLLCFIRFPHSAICKQTPIASFIMISIISINLSIFDKKPISIAFDRKDLLCFVGMLMNVIALFSSSLIEEEHQMWYFLLPSICIWFIHIGGGSVIAVLALHKILRCLNQTGDKYAHLPDVSSYLNRPTKKPLLSILHIASLICLLFIPKRTKPNKVSYTLDVILILMIYLHKSALGFCYFPYPKGLSQNGIMESRFFYALLILKMTEFFKMRDSNPVDESHNLRVIFTCIVNFCVFLSALLYRPHNVIFLPALLFYSKTLSNIFSNVRQLSVVHYWLGYIFYFYLGNSNSFSNIDIAPAYTGLTSYNIFTVSVLLIFHTFSPMFISFASLLKQVIDRSSTAEEIKCNLKTVCQTIFFLQTSQLLVYSIVLVFMREHLFIWSVFSPKLLFLFAITCVYIFLLFASLVSVSFVLDFQSKVSLNKRKKPVVAKPSRSLKKT